MRKYSAEMPDVSGRREKIMGLLGHVRMHPVEVVTDQSEKDGRWFGSIILGAVHFQVHLVGSRENLDGQNPYDIQLGFETEEELLAAIGSRGVVGLQEIIEQTEAALQ